MIKALIFDLWDTIGSKGAAVSRGLQKQCKIPDYPGYIRDFEESVQLTPWHSKEDMARNFLQSFNIEQSDANITFVISTFDKGIDYAKSFDGMKELLTSLSQNYQLGVLSNTNIFESCAINKWGLESLFAAQSYSWQTGALKPDKESFDDICKKLNVDPSECLFIDDCMKNVKAAQSYGFKTIKYENISQLRSELIRLGVHLD